MIDFSYESIVTDLQFNELGRYISLGASETVRKHIESTVSELKQKTPRSGFSRSGTIAGMWEYDLKTYSNNRVFKFRVGNTYKTYDKKLSIVDILNDGRGYVFPKVAKKLYIPLSDKGLTKIRGRKPGKSFKYGVDYIYALQSKPYAGTRFIDTVFSKLGSAMESEIVYRIGAILK